MKLEIFKTYIITHQKIGFICFSMFLLDASIFFDKKSHMSLCLYINYCGLNNLTIKNHYSFSFIDKFLDCPSYVKQFTQLDLTNAYY